MQAVWCQLCRAGLSCHTSTGRRMGFPCPFLLGASPVTFQLSPPKYQFSEGLIDGCFPDYCKQLLCNSPGRHQAEPCPSWALCSQSLFREPLSCSSPGISIQGPCSLIYDNSTSLGEKNKACAGECTGICDRVGKREGGKADSAVHHLFCYPFTSHSYRPNERVMCSIQDLNIDRKYFSAWLL